jgi:hypothetical protein
MANRWPAVAGVMALLLSLTACAGHGRGPGPNRPGTGSTPRSFDEQEKVHRKQAEDEARRLFELARIPPGAVALGSAPAALSSPAMGENGVETTASLTSYWRVPMSFPAAEQYVQKHPPAGLTQWASSSEDSPTVIVHAYAWTDGGSSHGELEFGLASMGEESTAGAASYLRVDARVEWLDPHPVADTRAGARMRLEAGNRCPADDRGIVGVRNDGPGFDRNLVPAETPNAGLLCSYAGRNGKRFGLLLQRVLSAEEARRIADVAHRVDLGHLDGGVTNCPAYDNSTNVLMLVYPHRAATNLWLEDRGCPSVSNGHVTAVGSPSQGALFDAMNQLKR